MSTLLLHHVVREPGVFQRLGPLLDKAFLSNPAWVEQVPVGVGEPLPGAEGLRARRSQRCCFPLRHREIRHTEKTYCAGAPLLRTSPLDEVVDVLSLLIGKQCAPAVGCSSP